MNKLSDYPQIKYVPDNKSTAELFDWLKEQVLTRGDIRIKQSVRLIGDTQYLTGMVIEIPPFPEQ